MQKQVIDIKILNVWRLESYNLSKKFIAESCDLSIPPLTDALKHGFGTPETIEKLTNFFNDRIALREKAAKPVKSTKQPA